MTPLDIGSFVLGLSLGLTVMGLVWLFFDIRRVLNEPRKLIESIQRAMNKDVVV